MGDNNGVLFYFDECLPWTHDFPFFLKYELDYGLISYGSLIIDTVYTKYSTESCNLSIYCGNCII